MVLNLFLALMQSLSWGTGIPAEQKVLAVGERLDLKAEGDLILGSEKVLKASDRGTHYRLEALKPGGARARIGKKVYEISVLRHDQVVTFESLRKATARSLGLKTRIERGVIYLEGRLLSAGEWERIAADCSGRDCSYRARLTASPGLRTNVERRILSLFQNLGFGTFRLTWEPEAILHVPAGAADRDEIEKVASAYGIRVQASKGALDLAPSIRVRIMILEMKRSESEKYGLQWPVSYSAQILPKFEQLDQALVSAHFLEQKGLARVLANPSLLCRSGKESEFLAGGEIPIKILSFKTQDVIWKKYGVLLKLKPVADHSGRMSLGIETEISSIDSSQTVDGVPGFFTNRVKSHFDLSEPRTIALSGLIKSDQGRSSEGLLGLSRIPVLGGLFSSRDFRENRTELVILVRPEIVKAHEEVEP